MSRLAASNTTNEPRMSKTKRILPLHRSPSLLAADSHPGLLRSCNDDSFFFWLCPWNDSVLLAVADGIGGHENGDIASNLAMQMLACAWREYQANLRSFPPEAQAVADFLHATVAEINAAVFNINVSYNICCPMGTTIAILAVPDRHHIITAHAGDSRIYRFRDCKLSRLTEDHSIVSELVKAGSISERDAAQHPMAHIISKSIGPQEHLSAELHIDEYKKGDRFLLCSDGLNLHLNDERIEELLLDCQTPKKAVNTLLNAALQCGGRDNVTVLSLFL